MWKCIKTISYWSPNSIRERSNPRTLHSTIQYNGYTQYQYKKRLSKPSLMKGSNRYENKNIVIDKPGLMIEWEPIKAENILIDNSPIEFLLNKNFNEIDYRNRVNSNNPNIYWIDRIYTLYNLRWSLQRNIKR